MGVKATPKRPRGSFKWLDPKTGIGYRKKLRCIVMTDPGWAYLRSNKGRILDALERMGGLIKKDEYDGDIWYSQNISALLDAIAKGPPSPSEMASGDSPLEVNC